MFPIVDVLISSGDIRDQTVKLFKIARTVDFGWVNICVYNFFGSGPKFTIFNAQGIALNEVCFLFSIHLQVLEIFAVKVESNGQTDRRTDGQNCDG